MRIEHFSSYAASALVVAACLALCSTHALADSYTAIQIGELNAGSASVRGIDSSGDALYYNNNGQRYTVYDHGAVVYRGSSSPASFVPDNGSSCSISYEGSVYLGVCNNGYEAVGITSPYGTVPTNTFVIGHDGQFATLYFGNPGRLIFDPYLTYINSSGDVAFTEVGQEDSFQAYNTTPTPEPSTWALLLTGVGVVFAGHRRLLT